MALLVRISVIVHATEDPARMAESLSILGVDSDLLEVTQSRGHYHNIITTMSASLRQDKAHHALNILSTMLPDEDILHISETLSSRTDRSVLYIRLDKQELASGRVRLDDSGSVKIRITAPPHDKDGLRYLGLD